MSSDKEQLDFRGNKSIKTSEMSTDWSLCIFCQKSNNVKLVCPADSKRNNTGVGYSSLSDNLKKFLQMGNLPRNLKLERLDDGQGLANTLSDHNAKWHKNCRDMYNQTKLNRIQNRKREDTCTFGLNEKIRSAALHIGDTKLLAKLSEGDVIAIEMKYHLKCLVSLYNRAKSTACQQPPHNQIYEMYHSIAFAELVTYIEEELTEMITPVIKLANMVKMYSTRLEQLGNLKGERVHSTRLKEKLLAHIPGLQAHKQGKDILFIRDADIGKVLSDAFDKNNDSDAMCLARAAQIIRRDMFQELFSFNGSFSSKYQEIYRSPVLIAIDLANAVCQTYNKANVVIPTSFKTDVFITAAVDNIDHNLSSMAATGSFHGTGISLFQHPDFDGQGNELNNVTITQCSSKKVNPLPDFYTNVPRVGSSLDHGDFEMKLLTNRHRAKMLSRHTKGRILAKKIDTWCRVIFPAAFTVFMLVYWYYYKS
ncbi:hypothetical protein GQR58_024753 [Nymphon striatum]|nr:hypothetical protein GQR58_024753 [Nymphon striatum]